jgi:hypothetical protein
MWEPRSLRTLWASTVGYRVTLPYLTLPYLLSISDSDVKQAIRRLGPSKFVGADEIPSFIIKGCSGIFASLLSHIFNIILLQGKFPTLWEQAAVLLVLKHGNSAVIINYRRIKKLRFRSPQANYTDRGAAAFRRS